MFVQFREMFSQKLLQVYKSVEINQINHFHVNLKKPGQKCDPAIISQLVIVQTGQKLLVQTVYMSDIVI